MKKRVTKVLLGLVVIAIATSCSTSNEVASNRGIQKRKYTKGFFVSHNKNVHLKNKGVKQNNEVVFNDNVINTTTTTKDVSVKETREVENGKKTLNNFVESVNQNVSIDKRTKINQKAVPINGFATQNVTKTNKTERLSKKVVQKIAKAKKSVQSNGSDEDIDPILLYLLAFFIPPVAVGLVTDWDMGQVVLNIILWALCVIPGIIHALIVVSKNV